MWFLRSYLISTGLLRLVPQQGHRMDEDLTVLLEGGIVPNVVSEHVVLRELDTDTNAVCNLLLMSGYLTAREVELREGLLYGQLAIPNRELRYVFRTGVRSWAQGSLEGGEAVDAMLRAMLSGNLEAFEDPLSRLVLNTFPYHDPQRAEPERVYQAFLLGLRSSHVCGVAGSIPYFGCRRCTTKPCSPMPSSFTPSSSASCPRATSGCAMRTWYDRRRF